MANRSHLTLVEECCDVCLFVARRSLHALWSARYTGRAHERNNPTSRAHKLTEKAHFSGRFLL